MPKDAKHLDALLYAERGYHYLVLAEEYERLSVEFRAKAANARKLHDEYRDGAGICFGEALAVEFCKVWDENIEALYEI